VVDIKADAVIIQGRLTQIFQQEITKAFNEAIQEGVNKVRAETTMDTGDLRNGYRLNKTVLKGGEFSGQLQNTTPNSLYRERGRGPGRMPPFGPGSELNKWARRKGIVAFLVARKIAKQGTERWRKNQNALGIDRSSTVNDIKVKQGGIAASIAPKIVDTIRKINL
jgi:hypothetical protein